MENTKLIEILKTIHEFKWVGNTVFDNLNSCLRSICLQSYNSGWYDPIPLRIKGLKGIYMVNEDGGLWWEHRIIKKENKFLIETLTNSGYDEFEEKYKNYEKKTI